MRMILLALLLVSSCALAQFDDLAFTACLTTQQVSTFSPTNISSFEPWAYSWYKGDSYSSTDKRWTNLCSNISAANVLDLTNTVANETPSLTASAINGLPAVRFDGNDLLCSVNYTSANPHEVWMVLCITNAGASVAYLIDSANVSARNYAYIDSGTAMYINGAANGSPVITNKWHVFQILYKGDTLSTSMMTNNVSFGTKNGNDNAMNGMTLGAGFNKANNFSGLVAEMATFKTNLTTVARSNIFNYFTNKYAISL